jgi:hypothetical protein
MLQCSRPSNTTTVHLIVLFKYFADKTYQKLFQGAVNSGMADINCNHMPSANATPLELGSRFDPAQSLLDGSGHIITPAQPPHSVIGSKHCGEVSGWISCPSPSSSLRNQSPWSPASPSLHSSSGEQLTGLTNMDCGMEMDGAAQETMCCSGGADSRGVGHTSSGGGEGGGLLRFGFKSSKALSSSGAKDVQGR